MVWFKDKKTRLNAHPAGKREGCYDATCVGLVDALWALSCLEWRRKQGFGPSRGLCMKRTGRGSWGKTAHADQKEKKVKVSK